MIKGQPTPIRTSLFAVTNLVLSGGAEQGWGTDPTIISGFDALGTGASGHAP